MVMVLPNVYGAWSNLLTRFKSFLEPAFLLGLLFGANEVCEQAVKVLHVASEHKKLA